MTISAGEPANAVPAAGGAQDGYAGDVSPKQAWEALGANADAVLVDVRSAAEWTFVGLPDLRGLGKQAILAAWQNYPGMVPNEDFLATVQGQVPDRSAPIFFLCRSGVRSRAAAIAATAAGHAACYNIAGGFEGGLDVRGHRGTQEGWKASGLPWMQS